MLQGQAMTGLLPILIGMKPTKTHKTRHGHNGLLSRKNQHTVVLYFFLHKHACLYAVYRNELCLWFSLLSRFVDIFASLALSLSLYVGFLQFLSYTTSESLFRNEAMAKLVESSWQLRHSTWPLWPLSCYGFELILHPWVLSDAFQRFKRGSKGTLQHEEHVLLVRIFFGFCVETHWDMWIYIYMYRARRYLMTPYLVGTCWQTIWYGFAWMRLG